MSRSLNQVFLIGNLTRDPETRALPSGAEFCRFSLALNYAYTTREGENKESVDFVDVTAWDGLAKIVQNYCHKGKQIMVQGRLRSSSWEKDGQTRSKLEVKADNILLLGSGSGGAETSADRPQVKREGNEGAQSPAKEEDYSLEEDLNYDQESVNPEDIPF